MYDCSFAIKVDIDSSPQLYIGRRTQQVDFSILRLSWDSEFRDHDTHCFPSGTGQIKEREWYGEKGMQHARTIKLPKQGIPTFRETIGLLMKVRSALDWHLSELTDLWWYLCLFPFSQKTSMSSSTWMSRFRMTRIDCLRLCTTLSSLSRIGSRPLRRESFWGSGIPGFCRLRNTAYRTVVVHI